MHRAEVEVVPLDAHTLFFILSKILTPKAKGHRGQKALGKQEKNEESQRHINVTKLQIFWFQFQH